jgi:hypothetical protein
MLPRRVVPPRSAIVGLTHGRDRLGQHAEHHAVKPHVTRRGKGFGVLEII